MMNLSFCWTVLLIFATTLSLSASQLPIIYIQIPEKLTAVERTEKYTDPINEALKPLSLGHVARGGITQDPQTKQIQMIWMEVEVTDIDQTLPHLTTFLKNHGTPEGTFLRLKYSPERIKEITLYKKKWNIPYSLIANTLYYLLLIVGAYFGWKYVQKKFIHPASEEKKDQLY
jgi:hypothetical protein